MDLEFRSVSKRFGAVQALAGVSFGVARGEVHACVGENGAGKSTLLRILAGLLSPDEGDIRWRGERLRLGSPREALERGIGMVSQEPLVFPHLSVAANIFAGREITRRLGRLDEPAMRDRTRALLGRLHVPVDPDTPMERLPAAYARLVQVARALAFDCDILVLDEPTTALTDAEADHLFGVLADLQARGVTILFVSHRMPEVFRVSTRITVLRDGRYVGTFERQAATPDAIVRAMVGREPPARLERGAGAAGAPVLTVRGLSRPPAFEDISLDVGAGEIVALFGLVGSGRTELVETIFGINPAAGGEVRVDGRPLRPGSVPAAVRAGLALVPEERHRQGLFPNLPIRDNIALAAAMKAGRRVIDRAGEARTADAGMAALAIRTPDAGRTPDTLSGGNQQKVVAAKWLVTAPRVLLLDEPTKGVDVGAKFEIHRIIRREANRGMACLVVSSEIAEVLALADRILIMREGRLCGELAGADATEQAVIDLAAHGSEATS